MRSQKATIFHRQVFYQSNGTCHPDSLGHCGCANQHYLSWSEEEFVSPAGDLDVDVLKRIQRSSWQNLCAYDNWLTYSKIVHADNRWRMSTKKKPCPWAKKRKKKAPNVWCSCSFYACTKSWRGYIFTAVCLCMCLSVCPALLVNKIPAERMHRFGRGFC